MNYASIKLADCANGPGMRTSLFVSGCNHRCKGCFNPETWSFDYGEPYTYKVEEYILSTLEPDYIDGLSILGGEPMERTNQNALLSLVYDAHEMGKTIWMYTGCVWEELTDERSPYHRSYTRDILNNINVMVDGPYIEEQRDISLRFRGSRNQRIIDVPQSLRAGHVILAEKWI